MLIRAFITCLIILETANRSSLNVEFGETGVIARVLQDEEKMRFVAPLDETIEHHLNELTEHDHTARNITRRVDIVVPYGFPKALGFLFVFGTIFVGVMVRAAMLPFTLHLPYRVVMLALGALTGYFTHGFPELKPIVAICYVDVDILLLAFLPIIVFNTSYNVDSHTFWKCYPQILLVSVPGFLLTASITGFMALYVIEPSWTFQISLLLGVACAPIYPMEVVTKLRETAHGKYASVLLLGEGLIGDVTAMIVFTAVFGVVTLALGDVSQIALFLLRMGGGGLLLGAVTGKVTGTLLSLTYNDTLCAVAVTLSGAYVTYYVGEKYLFVSGLLATVINGLMISKMKSIIASDVEQVLSQVWNILSHLANTLIFTMTGVVIFERVSAVLSVRQVSLVFVTYTTVYCARLAVYALLMPLLRVVGYRLEWRHGLACVWGGLRGPLSLCLALVVLETIGVSDAGEIFVIQVTGLVCLSLILNSSSTDHVLKLLGMSEISLAKKANMTNCIKRVLLTRNRSISMLKMDKFLADANWELVEAGTNIKHPYQLQLGAGSEESEDDTYMGYRYTTCPDCHTEIPNEPTKKEFAEMMREARARVLKATQISYWRQHERGKLSKDAVRTLVQASEAAADTADGSVCLEQLAALWKPKPYAIWLRKKMMNMLAPDAGGTQVPRGSCRQACHRLAGKMWFELAIYVVILANTPVILCEVLMHPPLQPVALYAIKFLNMIFYIIYLAEMAIKMLSFGFCGYFKSHWNKMDFLIIVMASGDLALDIADTFTDWNKWGRLNSNFLAATKLLRMLRFLRLFRLAKVSLPKLMAYVDRLIDMQLAFGYDVGKGFVTGEQEVGILLPQLVDNLKIQEMLIQKIDSDRLQVTRQLGLLQRDRPWTAITVKTRQAVASTLHAMLLDAAQLKEEGFLDEMEYRLLVHAIQEQVQRCRHKGALVPPCSPETQLRAVSWLQGNPRVAEFFLENAEIVNYNFGDVLISRGDSPAGMYILVSGVVETIYLPPSEQLDEALPNYDSVTELRFGEPSTDFLVSGNALGALGVLTGRPYDYTARCDSAVQAYYISMPTMIEAFKLSPNPILGLEAAMWREVGIKLAVLLLPQTPAYHGWSSERLSMRLEHAFVPCLKAFKIFAVNELMEDVMLVDGVCQDMNTREVFYPPCCIPRTAHRLIFPSPSQLVVSPACPPTRLLIAPAHGADELEIMQDEVDDVQCQLVSNVSSRCLYHRAVRRLSNESRSTVTSARRARSRRRRGGPSRRVNYRESVWSTPALAMQSVISSERELSSKYYKPGGGAEQARRGGSSTSTLGQQNLRYQPAEKPIEMEVHGTTPLGNTDPGARRN